MTEINNGAGVISVTAISGPDSGYALKISGELTATTTLYYRCYGGTYPICKDLDNQRGYTVEFQAKVVSTGPGGYSQRVQVLDNVFLSGIEFKPDKIVFISSGTSTYIMDTTDAFHTYRYTVKGSQMKVYVDNILRSEWTLSQASASQAGSFTFGDASGATEGGEVLWGYVRYSVQGAIPPHPIARDGWTHDGFDIQTKRRVQQSGIIRSNRSIVSNPTYDPAKVKISGTVAGSCWESFRDAVRRLRNSMGNTTQKIQLDSARYIEGNSEGISYSLIKSDFAKYDASFICKYPFFNNQYASYFSTAPVNNGTFYVTNTGDINVPLRVIVTGAASGTIANDMQITNTTTGEIGKYIGVLNQTTETYIDKGFFEVDKFSVTQNNASVIASNEGDLFSLNPGTNVFVYNGANVAGTLEFYWRQAYNL